MHMGANYEPMNAMEQERMEQQQRQVASYLARVMGWMCVGLLTTLAVGLLLLGLPQVAQRIFSGYGVFAVIFLQLAVAMSMGAALRRFSPAATTVLFLAYAALTGVTFTALFLVFDTFSLLSTFGVCAVLFFALSLYGIVTHRDLTRFGSLAFFGLLGVIVAGLVNLFLHNTMLDLAITVIGIVIFIALIAYDTQRIKAMYFGTQAQGFGDESPMVQNMAIYGAFMLYLDFINLFLRLIRVFGQRRDG